MNVILELSALKGKGFDNVIKQITSSLKNAGIVEIKPEFSSDWKNLEKYITGTFRKTNMGNMLAEIFDDSITVDERDARIADYFNKLQKLELLLNKSTKTTLNQIENLGADSFSQLLQQVEGIMSNPKGLSADALINAFDTMCQDLISHSNNSTLIGDTFSNVGKTAIESGLGKGLAEGLDKIKSETEIQLDALNDLIEEKIKKGQDLSYYYKAKEILEDTNEAKIGKNLLSLKKKIYNDKEDIDMYGANKKQAQWISDFGTYLAIGNQEAVVPDEIWDFYDSLKADFPNLYKEMEGVFNNVTTFYDDWYNKTKTMMKEQEDAINKQKEEAKKKAKAQQAPKKDLKDSTPSNGANNGLDNNTNKNEKQNIEKVEAVIEAAKSIEPVTLADNSEAYELELQNLERLKQAILGIQTAIQDKTTLLDVDSLQMTLTVDKEIDDLQRLQEKIQELHKKDYRNHSLLTDENGELITLYRGWGGAVDAMSSGGYAATYSSSNPEAAWRYAVSNLGSASDYKMEGFNIKAKNPLVIDAQGSRWGNIDVYKEIMAPEIKQLLKKTKGQLSERQEILVDILNKYGKDNFKVSQLYDEFQISDKDGNYLGTTAQEFASNVGITNQSVIDLIQNYLDSLMVIKQSINNIQNTKVLKPGNYSTDEITDFIAKSNFYDLAIVKNVMDANDKDWDTTGKYLGDDYIFLGKDQVFNQHTVRGKNDAKTFTDDFQGNNINPKATVNVTPTVSSTDINEVKNTITEEVGGTPVAIVPNIDSLIEELNNGIDGSDEAFINKYDADYTSITSKFIQLKDEFGTLDFNNLSEADKTYENLVKFIQFYETSLIKANDFAAWNNLSSLIYSSDISYDDFDILDNHATILDLLKQGYEAFNGKINDSIAKSTPSVDSSIPDVSNGITYTDNSGVIINEKNAMNELGTAVQGVTTEINNKTNALKLEAAQMALTVNSEIEDLEKLEEKRRAISHGDYENSPYITDKNGHVMTFYRGVYHTPEGLESVNYPSSNGIDSPIVAEEYAKYKNFGTTPSDSWKIWQYNVKAKSPLYIDGGEKGFNWRAIKVPEDVTTKEVLNVVKSLNEHIANQREQILNLFDQFISSEDVYDITDNGLFTNQSTGEVLDVDDVIKNSGLESALANQLKQILQQYIDSYTTNLYKVKGIKERNILKAGTYSTDQIAKFISKSDYFDVAVLDKIYDSRDGIPGTEVLTKNKNQMMNLSVYKGKDGYLKPPLPSNNDSSTSTASSVIPSININNIDGINANLQLDVSSSTLDGLKNKIEAGINPIELTVKANENNIQEEVGKINNQIKTEKDKKKVELTVTSDDDEISEPTDMLDDEFDDEWELTEEITDEEWKKLTGIDKEDKDKKDKKKIEVTLPKDLALSNDDDEFDYDEEFEFDDEAGILKNIFDDLNSNKSEFEKSMSTETHDFIADSFENNEEALTNLIKTIVHLDNLKGKLTMDSFTSMDEKQAQILTNWFEALNTLSSITGTDADGYGLGDGEYSFEHVNELYKKIYAEYLNSPLFDFSSYGGMFPSFEEASLGSSDWIDFLIDIVNQHYFTKTMDASKLKSKFFSNSSNNPLTVDDTSKITIDNSEPVEVKKNNKIQKSNFEEMMTTQPFLIETPDFQENEEALESLIKTLIKLDQLKGDISEDTFTEDLDNLSEEQKILLDNWYGAHTTLYNLTQGEGLELQPGEYSLEQVSTLYESMYQKFSKNTNNQYGYMNKSWEEITAMIEKYEDYLELIDDEVYPSALNLSKIELDDFIESSPNDFQLFEDTKAFEDVEDNINTEGVKDSINTIDVLIEKLDDLAVSLTNIQDILTGVFQDFTAVSNSSEEIPIFNLKELIEGILGEEGEIGSVLSIIKEFQNLDFSKINTNFNLEDINKLSDSLENSFENLSLNANLDILTNNSLNTFNDFNTLILALSEIYELLEKINNQENIQFDSNIFDGIINNIDVFIKKTDELVNSLKEMNDAFSNNNNNNNNNNNINNNLDEKAKTIAKVISALKLLNKTELEYQQLENQWKNDKSVIEKDAKKHERYIELKKQREEANKILKSEKALDVSDSNRVIDAVVEHKNKQQSVTSSINLENKYAKEAEESKKQAEEAKKQAEEEKKLQQAEAEANKAYQLELESILAYYDKLIQTETEYQTLLLKRKEKGLTEKEGERFKTLSADRKQDEYGYLKGLAPYTNTDAFFDDKVGQKDSEYWKIQSNASSIVAEESRLNNIASIIEQIKKAYAEYSNLMLKKKTNEGFLSSGELQRVEELEKQLGSIVQKADGVNSLAKSLNSLIYSGNGETKAVTNAINNMENYLTGIDKNATNSLYDAYASTEKEYQKLIAKQAYTENLDTESSGLTVNEQNELIRLEEKRKKLLEEINATKNASSSISDELIAKEKQLVDIQESYANSYNQAWQNKFGDELQGDFDDINMLSRATTDGRYDVTDEYTQKINKLKEEAKNLRTEINELDFNNPEGITDFKQHMDDFRHSIKLTKEELKTMESKDASKLMRNIAQFLDRNSGLSTEARTALQGYYDEINSKSHMAKSRITEIAEAFTKIQAEETKAGNTGLKLFDLINLRGRALIAQLATFISFYEIIGYVKQGIEVFKEFDTALAEMQKVSNESIETLKEFQSASFDLADGIGTDALSLQQSVAEFMRLGQSLDEATDSAQAANILFNVSEFDSAKDASTALIAMSQAYEELSNTQIIDVINKLGNDFPISTEGLATALQDGAASLTTAGNDFYEAAALVTAGMILCLKNMETYFYRTHLTALIA